MNKYDDINAVLHLRDTEYWNQFYSNNMYMEPSFFAKKIVNRLINGEKILELGCGNGRDSIFFYNNGMKVIAIDAADLPIKLLKELYKDRIEFICGDFVNSKDIYKQKYKYVYSRFTLHAITDEQEDELLKNVGLVLDNEGVFFVEARSINDDIYGKGEYVSENSYIYNNHFRRFIDINLFKAKLQKYNLQMISYQESNKFSPTKDSSPMLLRMYITNANSMKKSSREKSSYLGNW